MSLASLLTGVPEGLQRGMSVGHPCSPDPGLPFLGPGVGSADTPSICWSLTSH